MPHYFSENNDTIKSNPKTIAFRVNNTLLNCTTDSGVFSKDGLDRGTKVLLDYLKLHDNQLVLDLGCGYGVIGIYIAKTTNNQVDMVDINKRALELAKQNSELNQVNTNVFYSDGFESVTESYDLITLNPPIRAGKKVYYPMFEQSINYLKEEGRFVIVINKKHGAMSAIKYLESIYKEVKINGKSKGFLVITCKK
jgi:16S rRNA (guanine1207-N2)-methyltransferase